jgi:hypothetical protein
MFSVSGRIDPKVVKDISEFFKTNEAAAAKAARSSMISVTADILKLGKVNIAASGNFSRRWVSGLQAKTYPKRVKPHPNVKTFINHRYGGLASVHEFGATIRPKNGKFLWIPLPGAPKRSTIRTDFETGIIQTTRARNTPTRLSDVKGGLVYIKGKNGKHPMLGYRTGKGNKVRFKPAFVGMKKVVIPKRWDVIKISEEQANRNLIPRFISAFDRALYNGG